LESEGETREVNYIVVGKWKENELSLKRK